MTLEVADGVAGDLFALSVGRGRRPDPGQEGRGFGAVEADLGPTGVQIAEQDVQAVDAAGVLGDQVVATLGEQTQDRGVVLELDVVEAPVVLGDRGD